MSRGVSVGTERGNRSKSAIIRAAIPLFARRGYRGASLASIAESVEMTQPGVLHHFHSKEQLLIAVLDDVLAVLDDRDHEDGQRLTAAEKEGLKLLTALESVMEHNETTRDLINLFTVLVTEAVSDDHPAHDHVVARYAKVRESLLGSLETGRAHGDIAPDVQLEALVPVIVAVMDGLQLQWLLDPQVDMLASFTLFAGLLREHLSAASLQLNAH